MTRPVLAACDLDRTAIWSPSALDLPGPDEAAPTLVCVEVHEGRPLSFTTMTGWGHLAAMAAAGVLVPVTTRTVEQYHRVRLPGPAPRFALCANGGRLLVDGIEDATYSRKVQRLVAETAPVGEIEAGLVALTRHRAGVRKRRVAQDLFCYLVLDHGVDPLPLAAELETLCQPRGWVVSVQGRKIYALPAALTKQRTLDEVVERAGAEAFVAAGDALLDAGMLDAAVQGRTPRGSELVGSGWARDHVRVTAATGVLGGEEILGWLRRCTGPGGATG